MKVIHIVASIDDEAAGPSVSVPRLAEAQARGGADVEIATVGGQASDRHLEVPHVRYAPSLAWAPALSRLAISREMQRGLDRRAGEVDIFHSHGLWLMPNVYPAATARRCGKVFVISPRGMLGDAALTFSARKKRLFWTLFQQRAATAAGLFHATSDQEVEDIRAQGVKCPVVLAPNGVDIPDAAPANARTTQPRTILSLGRIHPKKGLDRLVRAWAAIGAEFPDWRLRIAGPNELGHADELRALAVALGAPRTVVDGPVFGVDKLAAYRQASVFVLPTLHENFAMTVAEALAAGTPVISTRGAPWAGLVANRCGWWVEHGPEALAAALREALNLAPAEIDAMGARGREWMAREFSWDRVAQPVLGAYDWMLHGGPRPSSVIV